MLGEPKYSHPLLDTEEYKRLFKEVKEQNAEHDDYFIMVYCLSHLKELEDPKGQDIIKSSDNIDNEV